MRTVSLIPLFLFWEASKETGLVFLARGFKGNSVPLTRGVQRGSSPLAGRIQRNLGFVAGVSKGGRAPIGTRSCLQGLVCYTFCGRGRRRGLATGQRKGHSATPGQAGFAGLLPEKAGAFEKQSPPGRQRLCALGWSEAEEKRAQPGRRWYIKSSRPSLKNSRTPSLVFPFFSKCFAPENAKCVIARKRPSRFLEDLDSPDRAKSGSPDMRNGAFSSYPIPQD